jgi:hypothetical protein
VPGAGRSQEQVLLSGAAPPQPEKRGSRLLQQGASHLWYVLVPACRCHNNITCASCQVDDVERNAWERSLQKAAVGY